jgi:hemin uptake protein HemP
MSEVKNIAVANKTSVTAPIARLKSSDLLRTGRELVIEHNGQEYRLIRTSNNKLLLVK